MDRKLRIGIIGTGGIGRVHMRAYKSFDDVEIVAAADIIPGKARKMLDDFELFEAKAFESHKQLCDMKDLDAVSICTYNTQHEVCTIDALNAGLHVLLEKPMSVTLDEAANIMRAEKKNKRIVTIGFQPRYNENCKKVKQIISEGTLGDVYYIQTGGSRRRGIPGGTFIDKEKAAFGAIGDMGCYSLDFALNSVGHPKPVTVSAYTSDFFGKNPKYYDEYDRFGVDDFSVALIRFENGMVMDYRMTWAMHMDKCSDFIFLGTDAGLKITTPEKPPLWGSIIDGNFGNIYLMHDIGKDPVTTEIPMPRPAKTDQFVAKIRDFVDAVKTNGPAPIPTKEIIYNQAIIDAMVRSAKVKREIEIEMPDDILR